MDTYKATNTTNGKFYIGSTTNFEKRKREHLRSDKNYPFQNALRKNPDAFEWEVWSDDSDEPILEQALLDMWFGKECCYNLSPYASRPPAVEDPAENGRKGGITCVTNQLGIYSPEHRGAGGKKAAETGAGCHTLLNRKLGGHLSGSKQANEMTGIFDPDYIKSRQKRVRQTLQDGSTRVWNSQREAAKDLGINPSSLANYIRSNRALLKGKYAGSFFEQI